MTLNRMTVLIARGMIVSTAPVSAGALSIAGQLRCRRTRRSSRYATCAIGMGAHSLRHWSAALLRRGRRRDWQRLLLQRLWIDDTGGYYGGSYYSGGYSGGYVHRGYGGAHGSVAALTGSATAAAFTSLNEGSLLNLRASRRSVIARVGHRRCWAYERRSSVIGERDGAGPVPSAVARR